MLGKISLRRAVDECSGVTCGGTASSCADGDNQYTCTCGAGWTGGGASTVCADTVDECSGVTCGGTASSCADGDNQ